jgi:hypothetical protein
VRRALALACLGAGLACAASAPAPPKDSDDYLRWVAVRLPVGSESILLRWPEERMPLKVYLPRPPEGFFDDADAIHDSVRDGIVDWTDVAAPGVPRFVFVEDKGDADIPIVWTRQADGAWYIAYCAYDASPLARRLSVSHISVTARWEDGRVADVHDVYNAMLHEMGHALGLTGHSPDPDDLMAPQMRQNRSGLTARDRNTLKALYARPIGARILGAKRERKD